MLVILSPGGFEQLWADLGQPGTLAESPKKDDPAVLNRLLSLAPQYQLEICS
jgi:hypothetical protein